MQLYVEIPDVLTHAMFLSCLCYAGLFFAVLLFQYFTLNKASERIQSFFWRIFLNQSSIDVQLLFLILWLLLSSTILYELRYSFPFLFVYVLVFFTNAISLRLVGERFRSPQKDGIFMQGMFGGLVILCTFILMLNSIYNFLLLGSILPFTSPLLGVLSYGLPLVWMVVEAVIEVFLIKRWLLKLVLAR